MNRIPVFIILCQLFFVNLQAQPPTIQDCLGAIPVCQQIYVETVSASGDGNYSNEIDGFQSCTDGEINSIWYVFTANENGNLGFLITPNNVNDDYDWALFDITNASCEDIFSDASLQVSCNAAGGGGCHGPTGANGDSNWDVQGPGCFANPPSQFGGLTPFNDFVPMQQGNTYVLMVSNWTGSTDGYTIDFGSSTGIGIIDVTTPEIDQAQFPDECNENFIFIGFSEFIQCNTIEDSNFVLTGPGGPYAVSLSSNACSVGGDKERFFTLTVDPPLQGLGDYQLALITDGATEVLDLCDNPAPSQFIPFSIVIPIEVTPEIGGDTTLLCEGNTLVLDATFPGGTYQWQDGSTGAELIVSTAGIYAVTVTALCGQGVDSVEVVVQMDVPNVSLGQDITLCPDETLLLDAANELSVYLWQDGSEGATFEVTNPGSYSVEVTNSCGTVTDAIEVNYYLPVVLNLGEDRVLCEGEVLQLDVTHPETASYVWQDGNTSPERDITQTGTYAVTVATACEVVSDVILVEFIGESLFDLGADTVLCVNESLEYDFSVPGATYLWQDGSTTSTYTVSQSGDYAVTIQAACNEILDNINVTVLDSIRTDLGRDTFLCPGYNIQLNATAGTLSEYEWQDGSDAAIYFVKETGVHTVRVYNVCEEIFDQVLIQECEVCDVYVPNAFSPNDDGFNDHFQPYSDCPMQDFEMLVFDRWGGMVFESKNSLKGWDGDYRGEAAGNAYYVWFMKFKVYENNRWREVEIEGGVMLLR